MIRRIALVATALAVVAWGSNGHKVVSTIAQKLLTETLRAQRRNFCAHDA
jgi:hypothetical protein